MIDRDYPPPPQEVTNELLIEQIKLLRKIERAVGYVAFGVIVIAVLLFIKL